MAHLLLVDDDDGILEILQDFLIDIGYTITCAGGGEEALRKLAQQLIDLMITDVRMPGISGIQLAELAAEQYPTLRIILISGYITPGVEPITRWRFLAKPFRMTILKQAIEEELKESSHLAPLPQP